ncbi:EOLA-like protein [Macrosteles quadrilineatus]|uniref:EOLA-like protein n=1 Tax=Macrosteles quadrilineatus TaxID=74068 RepID=UPI0023E14B19|nr:EOLA-like protein [Macrosteles quadrilineatus]
MADEMRILTVRQPWAWAIIHGGKDVENRVRNIAGDYRGPIAIHSGLAMFEEEGGAFPEVQQAIWVEDEGYVPTDDQLWEVADDVDPEDPRFVYGAILGVVDLGEVHEAKECVEMTFQGNVFCSRWAEPDGYHLVLANPRPLTEPIPYRGTLGLRRLDASTIARINEQLG